MSADFPWLRRERDGAVWLFRAGLDEAALQAAFAAPEGAARAPLGRGGFHYRHPTLGPVRIKRYRRGGLLGKFFPEAGLGEAGARRELQAEAALRGAGLLTQETLAMRIAGSSPRRQALQRYFPDEKTYSELLRDGGMSPSRHQAAESIPGDILPLGWYHADFNGGNLLWNAGLDRWRIIDLASLREADGPHAARFRAAKMRRRLGKPPRAFR